MRQIFLKEYSDESLVDLDRDISESVNPDFNEKLKGIPTDEYGFRNGTFRVEINWRPE